MKSLSRSRFQRFLNPLLVTVATLLVLPAGAAKYDHSPTVGPAKGTLIIQGGGALHPAIVQRFVELAGGPDANVVVIPTASADNQIDPVRLKESFTRNWGMKNVTILHTRSRKEANSSSFVEPLKRATAVWIPGGRQWRLADAYLGTKVEKEIKALLARGGVVGGSSAGATIQGSLLVRGASGDAQDPDGDNRIMLSPGHLVGFALLPNSAVDQHVIVRHRENDLVPVIASHPGLLGIGIDESTAIVVHGDYFDIIGKSKVGIYDGKQHDGKSYYFLSPGQRFDLKNRRPAESPQTAG